MNTSGRPLTDEHYMGVYMVTESIKNAQNRLDLKQLTPDDDDPSQLPGGYILKFEWLVNSEEALVPCVGATGCWNYLKVHDPAMPTELQLDWITDYVQQFHDVLHAPGFDDPVTGYEAYLDVPSIIDHTILNELSREMDAYIRSTYFYKDRDTKLLAGPLWDYNLTFGVGGFFENDLTAGWQYEQQRTPIANDWVNTLLTDPAFQQRLAARWQELRQGVLSDSAIEARIDDLSAPLAEAAVRNFERWPNLANPQVGPFATPTNPTWEGQVQFMRDWALARAAWLDTQWK